MGKAQSAVQVLERIRRAAEKNKVSEPRKRKALEAQEVLRQGDIYVHREADDHPRGHDFGTRQLVRGVTAGSRHVAEAPAKVYEGVQAPAYCRNTLLGPVVVSTKRLRITHPEHAALDLPAGTYQVTYQRDARTGGQVQD